MNTVRASVKNNQTLPVGRLLNSLYYTFPVGMFLTACNFMFESIRHYYFNWWIVVLPTLAIFVIGNIYEAFLVYQTSRRLSKRTKLFSSKSDSYAMQKSKMVGELV
jgi:hypothetical protein